MDNTARELTRRLEKLGVKTDEVSFETLTSSITCLACFPMYMVANVHAWTPAKQWRLSLIDLPGSEAIREAFAIGLEERQLDLDEEHRSVLSTLLAAPKASDLIIYEYALETIRLFLTEAAAGLAAQVRVAVAHMIVSVAEASGQGFLGRGSKTTPEERSCVDHIASVLSLRESRGATKILDTWHP